MKIKLNKITKNGKAIYLAYDQGLEHGPESDFNDKNANPLYILDIAKRGKYQGVVFQKGIAEKYNKEIRKSKVPLIVKLNGKTNLYKGEPYSAPLGTVEEAIKLGAKAVGYTIYIGSAHESRMFRDFERIEKEAHKKGLPIITWIYPRGKSVKNEVSREMMAYAARTGLELGADIVKMKWNGKVKDLRWAVKSAGRTKIVISGGSKKTEFSFLEEVKNIMASGAAGIAVGRNVWQSKNPLELTRKIQRIVFGNRG
jgi:class I fructose-bisphosphate aldolase